MIGNRAWFVVPTAILLVFVGLALRPSEAQPPGTVLSARLEAPRIPHPCERGARAPFTPTTIDIQNVGKGYPVVGLPRVGETPGVPPVSATHTVAWDAPGNKPGGKLGSIKLNAHTWPNGAALGNAMLANVHKGDIITLRSDNSKLCYRVTRVIEVDPYYDGDDFWADDGPPQIAMIVCSGQRLGPGNWSHRTIWFAEPFFGPDAPATTRDRGKNAVHKAS
jgi:hypothetical protein